MYLRMRACVGQPFRLYLIFSVVITVIAVNRVCNFLSYPRDPRAASAFNFFAAPADVWLIHAAN